MAHTVVGRTNRDCSPFTTHSLNGYFRRRILSLYLRSKLFLIIFRSYKISLLFPSVLSLVPLFPHRMWWLSLVRFLGPVCSNILFRFISTPSWTFPHYFHFLVCVILTPSWLFPVVYYIPSIISRWKNPTTGPYLQTRQVSRLLKLLAESTNYMSNITCFLKTWFRLHV